MKACIFLQGQYSKLGHALARVLKEQHGVTEFCAYVYSLGAAEFVRQGQSDIAYNPILVDHELHERFRAEQIDLQFLERFEHEYGTPHLWKYLYADRKLLMSIGPKEETTAVIDPLYEHDDLLRIFQSRARAIEEMLLKERPDFVFFFAIGAIGNMLVYHVAKKLGIRIFTIDFPRIGNWISLSSDYNTLTGIEEGFKSIRAGRDNEPVRQNVRKFLTEFRATGNLNLEYIKIAQQLNPMKAPSFLHPKRLLRTFKYLITLTRNWLKNRQLFVYGETHLNPLRFVWYNSIRKFRRARGLDDLYTQPVAGEEYAFFPLHYEPELSILVLSPFYFDQLNLIRIIARSLPVHMKLYVKEHPSMIFRRSRKYYKDLLKIPNVRLVPHTIKSFELIKNSKLVTVISSSAGWEACLLKKPLISFGEVFYNALPFVRRSRTPDDLPELIKDRLEHFDYDEKTLEDFLVATFEESFPFDYAGLWYQNDIAALMKDAGVQAIAQRVMKRVKSLNSQAA